MPVHGDVNDSGLMWCDIHQAWMDVEDRHLDAMLQGTGPSFTNGGRPPLLREIPHCIVGQVSELRCTCPSCLEGGTPWGVER